MKLTFCLKLYLPAIGILTAVSVICLRFGIPIDVFVNDPMDLLQGVPWVGLISNLGAVIWSATIGICFFASALLASRQTAQRPARLLFFAGAITTLIMLDDLFILHETVYRKYLPVSQEVIFGTYGLLLFFCFFAYRDLALGSKTMNLIITLGLFALSFIFEIIYEFKILPWHQLYEDGFKFLGIVGWMGYWTQMSADFLLKAPEARAPRPALSPAKGR